MKKFLYLIINISSYFIISCDNDDDNNNSAENNIVTVTDDINTPTTWYADSVYLISDYDFWVNSTLTIQPGTVIKFSASGPAMTVDASGTVIANATIDKPIYFTSINDDSKGGEINDNGTSTYATAGDWDGITLEGNGSSFNYCYFMYGGNGSYLSTLEVYKGRATTNMPSTRL